MIRRHDIPWWFSASSRDRIWAGIFVPALPIGASRKCRMSRSDDTLLHLSTHRQQCPCHPFALGGICLTAVIDMALLHLYGMSHATISEEYAQQR
jgi:hypothetical protein